MGPAEEMTHLARELTASYEARVSSVEQIIAGTHEMLETFRSQREAMRTRLREALARAASLRRRDFDTMMEGILARQEARELQIKETMRDYLREQRVLAATLKETLSAHLGRTQAEPARSDAERARGCRGTAGGDHDQAASAGTGSEGPPGRVPKGAGGNRPRPGGAAVQRWLPQGEGVQGRPEARPRSPHPLCSPRRRRR